MLAEDEEALLAEPEALVGGDLEAMERLAQTLTLSGFGMTICDSSAPASQGEHLVSHFLDMLPPPGLSRGYYDKAVLWARVIRSRFSFLDLASDAGLLNAETVSRY